MLFKNDPQFTERQRTLIRDDYNGLLYDPRHSLLCACLYPSDLENKPGFRLLVSRVCRWKKFHAFKVNAVPGRGMVVKHWDWDTSKELWNMQAVFNDSEETRRLYYMKGDTCYYADVEGGTFYYVGREYQIKGWYHAVGPLGISFFF